jgi:8-oxo-dGTP pyrophosphatase MutT (NUDIX family)
MTGPAIRTDIVEVFPFARQGSEVLFLQLRRKNPPAAGSWQPVMGHIEAGESAVDAALRELHEETGLSPRLLPDGRALWQLEAVDTFFLASSNCIMMCPGFAAEVDASLPVTLDDAHDQYRWVVSGEIEQAFLWPGQRHAARQVMEEILAPDARLGPYLRLL